MAVLARAALQRRVVHRRERVKAGAPRHRALRDEALTRPRRRTVMRRMVDARHRPSDRVLFDEVKRQFALVNQRHWDPIVRLLHSRVRDP